MFKQAFALGDGTSNARPLQYAWLGRL